MMPLLIRALAGLPAQTMPRAWFDAIGRRLAVDPTYREPLPPPLRLKPRPAPSHRGQRDTRGRIRR